MSTPDDRDEEDAASDGVPVEIHTDANTEPTYLADPSDGVPVEIHTDANTEPTYAKEHSDE